MSEAAVAILQTLGDDQSILLMRRAEREGDSWSGHWSFPGGRRDPQDRDLVDTALRELFEECGIRLLRSHLESELPHMIARRRTPPYLTVAPFVFRVDCRLETVLDAREAAGADWVPLTLLRDPVSHHLRPVPGRPSHMLFPAVDLCGAPLWGFTYRLITAWLGLDPPVERAGAAAAESVLGFLLTNGLTLIHPWQDRVAAVDGMIPVDRVLDHFSLPAHYLPGLNLLDVHPEEIRLAGPTWEEYRIRTVSG